MRSWLGRRGWLPLLLLLLLLPGTAFGHATLLSSDPPAGATLAEGPASLVLTFDEPVQLLALALLDDSGQPVPAGAASSDGAAITLPFASPLPPGRYLASWRAGSLDGHVISGSFAFAVGSGTTAPPPASVADDWRWPAFTLRALSRLALLFAAGSAFFLLLVARAPAVTARVDPLSRRAAWIALLPCLLAIAGSGAERAGLAPWQLLHPDAWRAALQAPGLAAWLAGLAGLLLLAWARGARLRLLGALLAPALLAAGGHALPVWPGWGQALMWLHGCAAALWLGALLPLRWALAQPRAEAAAVFRRFQAAALPAVILVLGSGLLLAIAAVPSWSVLWSGTYGWRLLLKLLLVTAMLAIAVINRLQLTKRALRGGVARALLARILALDLLVASGVVLLAAGLSLDPPRPAVASFDLSDDAYRIALTLRPAEVGDNRVEVLLSRPDGAPFDPLAVELRLAAPAAGVEPMTLTALRLAPGRYAIAAAPLWTAGPWELRLDLLLDRFTKLSRPVTVTLPR